MLFKNGESISGAAGKECWIGVVVPSTNTNNDALLSILSFHRESRNFGEKNEIDFLIGSRV